VRYALYRRRSPEATVTLDRDQAGAAPDAIHERTTSE
jgi:hypothetical protein